LAPWLLILAIWRALLVDLAPAKNASLPGCVGDLALADPLAERTIASQRGMERMIVAR
jgi:hypothetical protein